MTEMCERLTYYSILAGLILFCTSHLGINQVDASTINQVFGGFVFIIPIFGGFIADSYLGRFKTILSFGLVYIIGLVLIPLAAVDFESWGASKLNLDGKKAIFMLGLVFVALGTGGIKANVGPFGAEQVEVMGKDSVQSFFNWFYWVINVGALLAYTGVAYIQQEISFVWGFFVPLVSMLLALVIFVVVKAHYTRTEPKGSILTTAFLIVQQGACKPAPTPNPSLPEDSEKKALSRAKISFGGDFDDHVVDGVGSVIKVLPFCLLVIMYWAIYAQMTNTFFAQAERMDLNLGGGVQLPAAAMNAFNTISIIVLIPVADRLLYPCMEKLGKPLTYLKRIGIGMILSAAAVVVAGIVEIYRKEELRSPGGRISQMLSSKNVTASTMSVFVQVPQFALIGASEIFTSITSLEFAYNQAPVAMQGLLTGLFLAASGFGNWLSSVILISVEQATKEDPWWANEINEAKMENLMFLLGGLMMANFFVFVVVAHFYNYQDPATFKAAEKAQQENGEEEAAALEQVDLDFLPGSEYIAGQIE